MPDTGTGELKLYREETSAAVLKTTIGYRQPFVGGTLTSALNHAPAVSLASAATVAIGAAAANAITITGTVAITAFDTVADGAIRALTFAGVLTLTHNATSLILPGAANITTAAGDVAVMLSLGSGNWRCIAYQRANGKAVVATVFRTGILMDGMGGPNILTGVKMRLDVPIASGQVVKLIGVRRSCQSGSGTFSVRRNGTDVTNLTGLAVNTTPTTTELASPVTLADGDGLDINLTAATSLSWPGITLILGHSL